MRAFVCVCSQKEERYHTTTSQPLSLPHADMSKGECTGVVGELDDDRNESGGQGNVVDAGRYQARDPENERDRKGQPRTVFATK